MSLMTPDLPAAGADGKARAMALEARRVDGITPTSAVSYRSLGRLLIVGEETAAIAAARRLGGDLTCTLLLPSDEDPVSGWLEELKVLRGGGQPSVSGYLGQFSLQRSWTGADDPVEFDLVLDLGDPPLLDHEIPPVGYYAPCGDAARLDEAIATLTDMTGDFEKPRFFNYRSDICAHGRSGQTGCTRCIDVCPTRAIVSLGDTVEVNPFLCQGAGSCVAACPSGAMTYAFPTVADLLDHIRGLLKAYRRTGGRRPWLLLHDATAAPQHLARLAAAMPENVLPVEVEEIGSVGLDGWLASLAYGADAVVLLTTAETPPRVLAELADQMGFGRAIVAGMGYDTDCLVLADGGESLGIEDLFDRLRGELLDRPADFAAPDEKRTILRMAIDHLQSQAPDLQPEVALPAGAPFGQVEVDGDACTLCMGCVGVCPTAALQDGQGQPELKFVEWNCVQCGLCRSACPEDAITLQPRMLYDTDARQKARVLNEEPPFLCIACGRPFATASMIDNMLARLEGHWMFQDEAATRRLKLCENCRVMDAARAELERPKDPG